MGFLLEIFLVFLGNFSWFFLDFFVCFVFPGNFLVFSLEIFFFVFPWIFLFFLEIFLVFPWKFSWFFPGNLLAPQSSIRARPALRHPTLAQPRMAMEQIPAQFSSSFPLRDTNQCLLMFPFDFKESWNGNCKLDPWQTLNPSLGGSHLCIPDFILVLTSLNIPFPFFFPH